ncbi:hypothetical protein bsdE14_11290 [Clostridium omnivorum]|uniref:Uncharacterized protein n=1 Tax=Clostridium omnivorum TaxID=1604902 RepID=A0ABQ5N3E7_9CLOT|nr:hypothetical protein bsdE14_11290 [Clostridium sp. E14]
MYYNRIKILELCIIKSNKVISIEILNFFCRIMYNVYSNSRVLNNTTNFDLQICR